VVVFLLVSFIVNLSFFSLQGAPVPVLKTSWAITAPQAPQTPVRLHTIWDCNSDLAFKVMTDLIYISGVI
jgi:hypothetical protein